MLDHLPATTHRDFRDQTFTQLVTHQHPPLDVIAGVQRADHKIRRILDCSEAGNGIELYGRIA
jgi:hypothetical protein